MINEYLDSRLVSIANTKNSKQARGNSLWKTLLKSFVHLDNLAAPNSSQHFSPRNLLRGNLQTHTQIHIYCIYLLLDNKVFENYEKFDYLC